MLEGTDVGVPGVVAVAVAVLETVATLVAEDDVVDVSDGNTQVLHER